MTTDTRPTNADLAAIRELVRGCLPGAGKNSHDVEATWAQAVAPLIAKIEELRAVLAPLLAHSVDPIDRCDFCCVLPGVDHDPDCAVLRADALLGRA